MRLGFLIDEEEDNRWRRLAAYASKGWSLCCEKEETMTQGLRREETTCLPHALQEVGDQTALAGSQERSRINGRKLVSQYHKLEEKMK